MASRTIFLDILTTIGKVILKVAVAVAVFLAIDIIGLRVYGSLAGKDMFPSLWVLLVLEGAAIVFFGLLGMSPLPQVRSIGIPYSGSVRAVTEEIRRDRSKQVKFWATAMIVGFILIVLGAWAHG